MIEKTVQEGEQGQRFDKYLKRVLPDAPSSFLYKMLRKKNITLNGRRSDGREIVSAGDRAAFFLSDETFAKFGGTGAGNVQTGGTLPPGRAVPGTDPEEFCLAYRTIEKESCGVRILYEDDNVVLAEKRPGILSQKASSSDVSMNEWIVGYLLETGAVTEESIRAFRPSVCNRLDRNTGGILIFAKTLPGSREMAKLLKDRRLHKFYAAVVTGIVGSPGEIAGWLRKDPKTNTVRFRKGSREEKAADGEVYSVTRYEPVRTGNGYTLLSAELLTGRSHQLRVHFASIGHPLAGDPKYGDASDNRRLRECCGVRHQLLYAVRLEFPALTGPLAPLSEKTIEMPLPEDCRRVLAGGNAPEQDGTPAESRQNRPERDRTPRKYGGRT